MPMKTTLRCWQNVFGINKQMQMETEATDQLGGEEGFQDIFIFSNLYNMRAELLAIISGALREAARHSCDRASYINGLSSGPCDRVSYINGMSSGPTSSSSSSSSSSWSDFHPNTTVPNVYFGSSLHMLERSSIIGIPTWCSMARLNVYSLVKGPCMSIQCSIR